MESIEQSVTENEKNIEISVDDTVALPKTSTDTNTTADVIESDPGFPLPSDSNSENKITLDDNKSDTIDMEQPIYKETEKMNSLETVISVSETKNAVEGVGVSDSPLTNLFLSILKAQNPELVSDLKLNLNKEMVDCLLFILNSHPSYFSEFGKLLSLILEDGKINLNDVPYITLIVSKTYEFVHHFKKNIKHINDEKAFEVCANIMKTVFHVLVMKNVIHIHSAENKLGLISTFDSVVDSCVNLVKLNHILNNKGCSCFSFFKSKPKALEPKPNSE